MAAILFPVFGRARENARRSSCQSNLKQLGLGFLQYAQDNDERYPLAGNGNAWDTTVPPYVGISVGVGKAPLIFNCPSDSIVRTYSNCTSVNTSIRSYSVVGNTAATQFMGTRFVPGGDYTKLYYQGRNAAEFQLPSSTFMIAENVSNLNHFGNVTASVVSNPNPASTSLDGQGYQRACNGSSTTVNPVHFDGWNYLFIDGHVKWYLPEQTISTPGKTPGTLSSPKSYWTIDPND